MFVSGSPDRRNLRLFFNLCLEASLTVFFEDLDIGNLTETTAITAWETTSVIKSITK